MLSEVLVMWSKLTAAWLVRLSAVTESDIFLQCLDLWTISGRISTTEDKKDWSLSCSTGASADGVGPVELSSQAVTSCPKNLLFLFFKLERQVYHSWTRTGYHQPSAWPELTSRQHKATGIGPSEKRNWHVVMMMMKSILGCLGTQKAARRLF